MSQFKHCDGMLLYTCVLKLVIVMLLSVLSEKSLRNELSRALLVFYLIEFQAVCAW